MTLHHKGHELLGCKHSIFGITASVTLVTMINNYCVGRKKKAHVCVSKHLQLSYLQRALLSPFPMRNAHQCIPPVTFPPSLRAVRDKKPESCLMATQNSGALRTEVTCLLREVCCIKWPCTQQQKMGWLNDLTDCVYLEEKIDTFLGEQEVKNLRDPGRRLIPGEGEWLHLNFA